MGEASYVLGIAHQQEQTEEKPAALSGKVSEGVDYSGLGWKRANGSAPPWMLIKSCNEETDWRWSKRKQKAYPTGHARWQAPVC